MCRCGRCGRVPVSNADTCRPQSCLRQACVITYIILLCKRTAYCQSHQKYSMTNRHTRDMHRASACAVRWALVTARTRPLHRERKMHLSNKHTSSKPCQTMHRDCTITHLPSHNVTRPTRPHQSPSRCPPSHTVQPIRTVKSRPQRSRSSPLYCVPSGPCLAGRSHCARPASASPSLSSGSGPSRTECIST